jgi:hypothetical protein
LASTTLTRSSSSASSSLTVPTHWVMNSSSTAATMLIVTPGPTSVLNAKRESTMGFWMITNSTNARQRSRCVTTAKMTFLKMTWLNIFYIVQPKLIPLQMTRTLVESHL